MKGKKKYNQAKLDEIKRKVHKNKFLTKFENLCTAISNDPIIYKLIPKKDIDFIYNVRGKSIRVQVAEGQDVPATMLNESKTIISQMLKQKAVPVTQNGRVISLDDYYTVGLSLLIYLNRINENSYSNAVKVKNALEPFRGFIDRNVDAFDYFLNIMGAIAYMYSDFNSRIYLLKYTILTNVDGKSGFAYAMEIYCQKPEKISVTIDNHVRPAFRMGWMIPDPITHMDWINIKMCDLPLKNSDVDKTFDVFIQTHALHRLHERIDCIIPGIVHLNLYLSLKNMHVLVDKQGCLLFEFKIQNVKVGYLSGEIIDEKIIIKTFLFLTNNGTPEGDRLHKNTGLKKDDKRFLEIDKLSTFISSDLGNDERVKRIFTDAGCGSLFEINKGIILAPLFIKQKSIAQHIKNYIGLKDDDENLF